MKLNDRQNLEFMNHPDRVIAQKRLNATMERMRMTQTLSAQAVLTCMPIVLKQLSDDYENLIAVEAKVEAEILAKGDN